MTYCVWRPLFVIDKPFEGLLDPKKCLKHYKAGLARPWHCPKCDHAISDISRYANQRFDQRIVYVQLTFVFGQIAFAMRLIQDPPLRSSRFSVCVRHWNTWYRLSER